jgi:hypothetical protein
MKKVPTLNLGDKLGKSMQALSDLVSTDLADRIQNLMREQRIIRTNEHRNFATVRSAESRIVWFAIIECVAILGLAVGQVYIIQMFFAKTGRLRV